MSLSYPGLHIKFQETQWYISSPCLKELRKKYQIWKLLPGAMTCLACFRHFVANGTSWNLLRLCTRLQITMCPCLTSRISGKLTTKEHSEEDFSSDFLEAVAKTAFLFLVLERPGVEFPAVSVAPE